MSPSSKLGWSLAGGGTIANAGYSYIFSDGFSFPFGDYFEMSIDGQGMTHAVWGEGLNYKTPGSIWYNRGH